MRVLLWAESQKLRRSKIAWIAVFATVMVVVIVFAQGQFSYSGEKYIDGAGWLMTAAQSLGTFFVLPAVVALLGSYMICREEEEDTLKSLKIIPIDEMRLTFAKLSVTLLFSIIIYLLLFAGAVLIEAVLHFGDLSAAMLFDFIKMYLIDGIGVFFAVSPIIAIVAWVKKGYWLALVFAEIFSFASLFAQMSNSLGTIYPFIAVFNLSGYYSATQGQSIIGLISLLACGCIAVFILMGLRKKAN